MDDTSHELLGLKLVVFGFQLSVVGRFALQSFALVLLGVLVSVFGLLLE